MTSATRNLPWRNVLLHVQGEESVGWAVAERMRTAVFRLGSSALFLCSYANRLFALFLAYPPLNWRRLQRKKNRKIEERVTIVRG